MSRIGDWEVWAITILRLVCLSTVCQDLGAGPNVGNTGPQETNEIALYSTKKHDSWTFLCLISAGIG